MSAKQTDPGSAPEQPISALTSRRELLSRMAMAGVGLSGSIVAASQMHASSRAPTSVYASLGQLESGDVDRARRMLWWHQGNLCISQQSASLLIRL
jgi:hypothetical protein